MFTTDTHHNGITYLIQDRNKIMSNSVQELLEHKEFLDQPLHGDILVTGLGLGFINQYLLPRKDILSVTIVEKYQEVIDLVWDSCPRDDRFRIVHADADKWIPDWYFDWAWFDSWTDFYTTPQEKWMDMIEKKYKPYCENIFFWIPEEDRLKKEYINQPVP